MQKRHQCARLIAGIGAVLFAAFLPAQAPPGTGVVTGQAFCSDTQKPARFATVTLASTSPSDNPGGRRGFGSNGTTSGADGSFTLKNVPAGTYDLQVSLPGYIQPLRQLNFLDNPDPARMQPWLRMMTRITVQAGQTVSAAATAYRGADLQGTVLYDDGSPASGLIISTLAASAAKSDATATNGALTAANADIRPFGVSGQTDDRGHFSLSGLADGAYTIQALPRGNGIFPVYLGNTYDRTLARLVTVKAGELRSDLDMQIDITNLHQVRGALVGSDNHPLANARVSLSATAGGPDTLHDTSAADGSFSFANVPDGKFTVSISGARDPDSSTVYKSTSTQITVNGRDITDVMLAPSP